MVTVCVCVLLLKRRWFLRPDTKSRSKQEASHTPFTICVCSSLHTNILPDGLFKTLSAISIQLQIHTHTPHFISTLVQCAGSCGIDLWLATVWLDSFLIDKELLNTSHTNTSRKCLLIDSLDVFTVFQLHFWCLLLWSQPQRLHPSLRLNHFCIP